MSVRLVTGDDPRGSGGVVVVDLEPTSGASGGAPTHAAHGDGIGDDPSSIRFVGSGRNSAVFSYLGVAVKLMLATGAEDNSTEIELRMLKLGDKLRRLGVSPHFPRLVGGAATQAIRSRDLLRHMPPGRQRRVTHIVCMEKLDCSLRDAIVRGHVASDAAVRVVAFQVLYTVAALQRLIPGLRHNDLSCRNVLVRRLGAPAAARYAVPGQAPAVCVSRWRVCVTDFDFLDAPSCPALHNLRVRSGRYAVRPDDNPTYDTHFFLFSLRMAIEASPRPSAFAETAAWLRALPVSGTSARPGGAVRGLEPLALLGCRYFDALRARSPGLASPEMRWDPGKKMAQFKLSSLRELGL